MSLKTYPEMNEMIKDVFRKRNDFSSLYAATRIVELEQEVERLQIIEQAYDALKKSI